MRTIRIPFCVIVLLCFACMVVPTLAQSSPTPLIILNEGDLWGWDGSGKGLKQLTSWGYNQQPVLSPDGRQVAYMAWSPITIAALAREGAIGGGEVPGDIKVLDVASQQEVIIAGQRPEASFFTPGVTDNAVIRSQPVWSPDGTKLAWTEYDYPGEGLNRIVTYDFSTHVIDTLVSPLPAQAGVPVPMEIAWGETGLVVRSITPAFNGGDLTFIDSFLVFGSDGVEQFAVQVDQTAERFITNFILLNYDGQEFIGVEFNTSEWELVNPLTGETRPAPGRPELYCTSAPEKSLSVAIWPDEVSDGVEYQLLDLDGNPIGQPGDMGPDFEGRIALSPSGGAMAYVQYDADTARYDSSVTIWNNGEVSARFEVNPRDFSFLWGPTAWRIRPVQ